MGAVGQPVRWPCPAFARLHLVQLPLLAPAQHLLMVAGSGVPLARPQLQLWVQRGRLARQPELHARPPVSPLRVRQVVGHLPHFLRPQQQQQLFAGECEEQGLEWPCQTSLLEVNASNCLAIQQM